MNEMEITVTDLKQKLDNGDDLLLLDVRERNEWEFNHLEGATLIPMSELQLRRNELPHDKEIVVYCHTGSRSLQATRFLQAYGYKAKSLNGGIDDWAVKIDPTVPRY